MHIIKIDIIILNKLKLFWYIHAAEMYFIHFCSLCNSITPHNLKSLVHRISHYGKCKMVDLVGINCRAYFLDISVILFINLHYNSSRWCISRIILNICKEVYAFLKTIYLYKQHHTMDHLQKPVTYSKSLVHLSKVSIYVNEHISAIRINSYYVIVYKQDGQNTLHEKY